MLDSEPDTGWFSPKVSWPKPVSAEARTNKDGSFQFKLRLKGPDRVPRDHGAKRWLPRRLKYCNNVGDAKAGADPPHGASLRSRARVFFFVFGGALRFLCPARVEKVSAFWGPGTQAEHSLQLGNSAFLCNRVL